MMIMRRKIVKMDKMENVDFVRQRYATILRDIYSHSQGCIVKPEYYVPNQTFTWRLEMTL